MRGEIDLYDVSDVAIVQGVALQCLASSKRSSDALRLIDATTETCEALCFDDSSEQYGALYVYVKQFLGGVIGC